MKKVTLIIAVLALLVSSSIFAATVNNVELLYKDGFTIAQIDVDGTVRFSHQTEEAKDGKPFRVIVDVLSATHNLGKHSFANLPNCPIQKIRSSQYAVQPEQVVRVVFDMDSERIYRIDSDQNSITLTFSDKSTKPFEHWASADQTKTQTAVNPVMAQVEEKAPAQKAQPKSTAQLNKSINDDRMLSLESSTPKTNTPPVQNKTVAVAQPKVESTPAPAKKQPVVAAKPKEEPKKEAPKKATPPAQKQTTLASQPQAKPAPAKKNTTVASTPDQFVGPTVPANIKPTPVNDIAPAKAAEKKADQPKAESKPAPVKKQPVVAAKPKEEPKKEAPKTTAQKPAQAQTTVAKTDAKADEKADQSKSTSRFRRNPAQSKKIQGTLVAEFPKRLVIKYKTTKYRDPFETLINETKTYNDPVNKIVPNVEGLRLVGIIQSDDNGNRALFEDNTGYGYILKTGDKVKKGYVLRVDNDRVYFQIFEYGWSRTVSLVLES